MPKPERPDAFRPEESPILWFGEMLLAVDRGDFDRAAECQRELTRLGWRVDRRKPRQAPRRVGGGC
ncbi:hypothetical protein [Paludisphaera soli]|uniref:hypothetical protein n=1 Tax=Paludisphaera soli TaxID=2712865 RepID=UPI0013EAB95D|nr:hypothetical protein [Paludisphaera soli]